MLAEGSTIDSMPILGGSCIVLDIMVGPRDLFEAMNRTIVLHGIRPVIVSIRSEPPAAVAKGALITALV
jgi:hypothetical protein